MKKSKNWLALLIALVFLASVPAQAASATGQTMPVDGAQAHNAMLAAGKISGIRLQYGESFSFNETVGPRTGDAGFIPALNGRGVEVVGGGCAQAASALYLALCGLEPWLVSFDELSFYGDRYAGSYVSDGSQAVLVDYANGRDFRFTSLVPGVLSIFMDSSAGGLLCTVSIDEAPAAEPTAAPAFRAVSPAVSRGVVMNCGSDPAVVNNVAIAAASVHDTMLSSGDVFSFNDVVGPRDEAFGYVPALNGRGAEVVGGGCAQVASALWLMIQDDPDFVIVSKSTYGSKYNQSYVSSSADAILVDYNAGTDFAFRYVGHGSITLYATVNDGELTVGRG